MADRTGKLCDDCLAQGTEKIIGTCGCPIMYMVIGTYDQGEIENNAELPRFGWEIYAEYGESKDALKMRAVPRAELCAACWVKCLTRKGALDLLTHDEYYAEAREAWQLAHPKTEDEKTGDTEGSEE